MKENLAADNSAKKVSAENEMRDEKNVIPVIEEQAYFGKKIVETGKVRISKRISEHEETIDEPLFSEKVSVERVQVSQYVDEPPKIRQEGDVMIFPIVEEKLIVEKRLMLVEELHVSKQLSKIHQPQTVTLRKEEIDVKRIAESENSSG